MAKRTTRRTGNRRNKNRNWLYLLLLIIAVAVGYYNSDKFETTKQPPSKSTKTTSKTKGYVTPRDKTFSARVVKVSDGDTFTLLNDNDEQIRVRFYGVDAPESKQDYGQKAKEFTADLCAGKVVTIENKGVDKYGRVIGIVHVGGKVVNEELLRNGLAWHYAYYDKSPEYAALEQQARRQKLNIWSMRKPVAPWDFRKSKKLEDK